MKNNWEKGGVGGGGLLERGALIEDLQNIFAMGFRTAYKLRGLYLRGPIITRGTLRQAIYALADKMNTFCICWFLILPSKIQNEFRGVVISQDQLPPATAQNFHLTLHGVNIDISWNLILISLRKQLTFCNATFALPIKV